MLDQTAGLVAAKRMAAGVPRAAEPESATAWYRFAMQRQVNRLSATKRRYRQLKRGGLAMHYPYRVL